GPGLPDTRVVEHDHAEVPLEAGGLEGPRRVVGAEAVDQQDRLARAVLLVVDGALADLSDRHPSAASGDSRARAGRSPAPCRGAGSRPPPRPTTGTPRPCPPSTRSASPRRRRRPRAASRTSRASTG